MTHNSLKEEDTQFRAYKQQKDVFNAFAGSIRLLPQKEIQHKIRSA
jgi:hypothetical protein